MSTKDPRVDAYIAKAASFAKPILEHLRALVHRAAPGVSETIKWSMPFFEEEGLVCHMAAFKAHCAFGFWNGARVVESPKEKEAMGQFGRIESLADLGADREIVALVKKAVALNRSGEKVKRPIKHPKKALPVPADLAAALRKGARARKTWEAFAPSHRREYLEWLAEAKTEATRARRFATTLDLLTEGKRRMWKYR